MLGPAVLEVLREVLRTGQLGDTMSKGVISLIHKKGETSVLENWRPLTMLTVEYKLLAKVLADRLRQVMPDVVAVDQTCGVAGRSTRWNLQLIRDCIAWAEQRKLLLMVAALNLIKCLDLRAHVPSSPNVIRQTFIVPLMFLMDVIRWVGTFP